MNKISAQNAPFLDFNVKQEVNRLCAQLKDDTLHHFRRRGVVVGCSGGVDSAVVLALAVRSLGSDKVLAVLLPEKESSPESVVLAKNWAEILSVEVIINDITDALKGTGCYRRRDEAIRRIFPDYGDEWKSKITLPGNLLEQDSLNIFSLTVVKPDGEEFQKRLLSKDFFQVVAASNLKQRTRMAMLYYYAELRNFIVVGTGNKNEHDLGFFVKYGDGGADISPILHLYKTQVYQLAEYLDVPIDIRSRTPTSDTYSAGSSQEEFFFRIPFDILDYIWAGWESGVDIQELADEMELTTAQVHNVVDDIQRKKRTTQYLRSIVLSYE